MAKPIDALKTIARYVEAKKPKTLAEAEHMLDPISVMADETILDAEVAESRAGFQMREVANPRTNFGLIL